MVCVWHTTQVCKCFQDGRLLSSVVASCCVNCDLLTRETTPQLLGDHSIMIRMRHTQIFFKKKQKSAIYFIQFSYPTLNNKLEQSVYTCTLYHMNDMMYFLALNG